MDSAIWGWRQPDSVWYPRLLLFHQPVDEQWQPVIDDLREALVAERAAR